MVASADGTVWLLDVAGDCDEFIEPPAGLEIQVRSRSKSIGWDGYETLGFLLAVPWDQVASDLSLNLLASWLYDLFARRRKPSVTETQRQGTNITINGNVFIVGDAAQLAPILKGLLPGETK